MEGIGRQGGTKETEKRRKFGVRIEEEENSRKSVTWSAVPDAPKLVCGNEIMRGAAAPKGPMTYDST